MTSFKRPNDSMKLRDSTSKHLIPAKEAVSRSANNECTAKTFSITNKKSECFEKKSFSILVLSLIVLLIILIIMVSFVLVETKKKIRLLENADENTNRCQSVNCYQMSNFILDNLNQTGNKKLKPYSHLINYNHICF